MTDRPIWRLAGWLGLPRPPHLRRYAPDDPLVPGPVLVSGTGRHGVSLGKVLASMGVEARDPAAVEESKNAALVFDATGITEASQLRRLYDFFHPHLASLIPCGRVVVLGCRPVECTSTGEATAQRALEGFVRSVGKEIGQGST